MTGALTFAVARVLMFVGLLAAPVLTHSAEANADIFGVWRIKAFVGAAEVSSLSQREVDQLIGTKVLISRDKFSFNGQTCVRPDYTRSREDASEHFTREWRANANEFGVPKTVTVVETGCNTLYPLRRGRLLIAERGNFFEALRERP